MVANPPHIIRHRGRLGKADYSRRYGHRLLLGFTGHSGAGEIPLVPDIDSPYEEPESPDLRTDTAVQDLEQSVAQEIDYLARHEGIDPAPPFEERPSTP